MMCQPFSNASRQTKRRPRFMVGLTFLGSLLFTSLVAPFSIPQAAASASAAQYNHSGSIYFSATGHSVNNGFLSFWLWNGQEARWGKPISEEYFEDGYTVQYFERGRLEYHPEAAASKVIQASNTGSILAQGRDFQKVDAFRSTSEAAYYAETGHSIQGNFLGYWKNNGGIASFGYPISEQFREGGHTVQYFQKARFELTSGGGIWLGFVGRELLDRQAAQQRAAAQAAANTAAPEFEMSFTGGATWFPGNWNRIIALNKSWGNLPANFKGYGFYAAMPADLNLYGRWGRVTRGNQTLWVQFVDVIAYKDIAQVRADGKVIDLGVESFQHFAPLSAGTLRVTVDVAWPGFKPSFIQ